jgi:hypothetical protein
LRREILRFYQQNDATFVASAPPGIASPIG